MKVPERDISKSHAEVDATNSVITEFLLSSTQVKGLEKSMLIKYLCISYSGYTVSVSALRTGWAIAQTCNQRFLTAGNCVEFQDSPHKIYGGGAKVVLGQVYLRQCLGLI